MPLLKKSLNDPVVRVIPLAGSLSSSVVATLLFVAGEISLATVGIIVSLTSFAVALYLSFVVETTENTRLGVLLFMCYSAGMGLLTAPGMFGYEYLHPPARILSGLLLGLVTAIMWLFYVRTDELTNRPEHRNAD